MSSQEWKPMPVDKVMQAFPAIVSGMMPAFKDIPPEFDSRGNAWHKLVDRWFFSGIDGSRLTAKTGINKNEAVIHLTTIMRSFEPKHEHKIAAVAYLMSLWFEPKGAIE